jgi:amino acid transporter
MNGTGKPALGRRIKRAVIGKARDPKAEGLFHKATLIAFFAWVGLGADGLSSSCYGPEEAFLALGAHFHLSLFVGLGIALTVVIITASYSQIVELFPHGGGGYTVATQLLSPAAGMVSGSALLIDYVLTIAISVSSGADALFSFFPAAWRPWKLAFITAVILLLVLMNLRGVRESVLPLIPIFLLFVATHLFAILYTLFSHLPQAPALAADTTSALGSTRMELGALGMVFLVLRAYGMGAGTYTGIEAVSNSMRILREPKVKTAKRTMRYMAGSLAVLAFGLMVAYVFFGVSHVPGKTLNAVLFERMTAGWGGAGHAFVVTTLVAEAVLLIVAAQTGFLDGSNVLANMASGRWLPSRFALLSDRFVTLNGILFIGGAALVTVLATGGAVKFLIVLYSINVFITFTLSQTGMVRHWWLERKSDRRWRRKIAINGVGLSLTVFILASVVVLKFHEGGWITLLVTGSLIVLVSFIRRHYNRVGMLLKRLDSLTEVAALDQPARAGMTEPLPDPSGKTAVFLVSGFNGLGLHTLFTMQRTFHNVFRNFLFVEVGIIDTDVFRGSEDIARLERKIEGDLARYTEFMMRNGFYARGIPLLGTEVSDTILAAAPAIMKEFPNAVFFGGQIIFPRETFLTPWLHNYTVFDIQKKMYYEGIPVMMLPIRVNVDRDEG